MPLFISSGCRWLPHSLPQSMRTNRQARQTNGTRFLRHATHAGGPSPAMTARPSQHALFLRHTGPKHKMFIDEDADSKRHHVCGRPRLRGPLTTLPRTRLSGGGSMIGRRTGGPADAPIRSRLPFYHDWPSMVVGGVMFPGFRDKKRKGRE